jgi:rRNA-processing protein FCF1
MVKKKRGKRALTFYRIAFGLEPTYKVLVHPELVRVAIRQQINLREQLPRVLHDSAIPCTTKCILHHLRQEENDSTGAAVQARKYQIVPCSHQKVKALHADGPPPPAPVDEVLDASGVVNVFLSPDLCISELLGEQISL